MADLHGALGNLGPVEYADVPLDDLSSYLKTHFEAGELICNSVPSPPGGDPFDTAAPHHSEPDLASSSKDIRVSTARSPYPHAEHADLQSSWGKPYKLGAKENPLDVKVYKMAGGDRHGAWFARRSVHEGISFKRFRQAMKWEFLESLATEGGPGAGAVRGIGADKRLENHKVGKDGNVQVYQLSAQFPGPTTPREFITLLLTSENALSEKSAANGEYIPKHFMIVSKPVTHPDAPERSGYIRGSYESVELIREIPLHKKSAKAASTTDLLSPKEPKSPKGRDRGHTVGFAESRGPDAKGENIDKEGHMDEHHEDLNPVEWIMVTRSEPGGGIPRFMVERGTPSSICADVAKFFDWACSKTEIPNADDDGDAEAAVERRKSEAPAPEAEMTEVEPRVDSTEDTKENEGYFCSAQKALEAGIDAYAPTAVANIAHGYLNGSKEADDDDSSSTTSYESAGDYFDPVGLSAETLPLSDSLKSQPSSPGSTKKQLDPHEKEMLKLEAQRRKLEAKLNEKRETETKKLGSLQHKNSSELQKAKDRHSREMKKREERHGKEVEKIEEKKRKEVDKAKKRRQKQLDRDVMSKLTRERDDFRTRVELVQRENTLLREQIGEVQRENTALVRKLTKLAGGEAVYEEIRKELQAKKKADSVRSVASS